MEDYTVTYENLRLAPFKVEHIVALSLSKSSVILPHTNGVMMCVFIPQLLKLSAV